MDTNLSSQMMEEKEAFGAASTNLLSDQEREEINRKMFLEELSEWMQEIGKAITKMPVMGYKELDLYQFYKEVQNNGGFAQVTEKVGTWSKIWKKLDNYDASITDASFRLKKNYERFLLDFEYKCFPERRQQQKVKPPKGKRSRSNSASNKDKIQQQQMARQHQQQIEQAQQQLHQLEIQQQLEAEQLQEVQRQFEAQQAVHHMAAEIQILPEISMSEVDLIAGNELVFDDNLFRMKLDNEYRNLQTGAFLDAYVDPFSPKIPPKRPKPEFNSNEMCAPEESTAPHFDPTYPIEEQISNWNLNNRCAFGGEDKKFSSCEEWVNYVLN